MIYHINNTFRNIVLQISAAVPLGLQTLQFSKIPFTEKVYLKNVELNIIALIDFEFTDNYEKCSETVLKSFATRF